MKKINVTYEVIYRIDRDFEITDEEFDKLADTCDLYEVLGDETIEELHYDAWRKGDSESDYRVIDEDENEIIPFG